MLILLTACESHDYSVDQCISLHALETTYGSLTEAIFLDVAGPEPSEFPEITFFTHQRGNLSKESEARARSSGHLPNNALPEYLDYFMAAHPHEMLYEYYTLPRGSDSGYFRGSNAGIMRGFRKFGTRKYDMLLWKIPRKTGDRRYELVEIIFHYPLLLNRLPCQVE